MRDCNLDYKKAEQFLYRMFLMGFPLQTTTKKMYFPKLASLCVGDEFAVVEEFVSNALQCCLCNNVCKVYLDENEEYELLQNTPGYKWRAIKLGKMCFPVVKVKSESNKQLDEKKEKHITFIVCVLAIIIMGYCLFKGYM